jgi:hypothetical protein
LSKVEVGDRQLHFEIDPEDGGESVTGDIPALGPIWSLFSKSGGEYAELSAKHFAVAEQLEKLVWAKLSSLVGKKITIASYWGLTQPVLFGIVIWEGEHLIEIPFEPHWFERKEHITLTQSGLRLSFEARRQFAGALPPAPEVSILARQTNVILLSHLVSDWAARERMLTRRFAGLLASNAEREALERWVAVPLIRQEVWRLEDPALSRIRNVFDFPAFINKVEFLEILPQITHSA